MQLRHLWLGSWQRDDLRIGNILITTFTRNAAMELRHRIRKRLISTASDLRSSAADASDTLTKFLNDTDEINRSKRVCRLERALVEFDTATISTIHGSAVVFFDSWGRYRNGC